VLIVMLLSTIVVLVFILACRVDVNSSSLYMIFHTHVPRTHQFVRIVYDFSLLLRYLAKWGLRERLGIAKKEREGVA
jgi:hypothetical protein